ncbi:MAG TPA: hypothetical protein VHM23_02300 [Actinomycetota bacterium]|jgi:hypothetical protein|nr:hypothetical protein [Actinomycetota bacterium]
MTRRPTQAHPEESRAAMARVFGVDVEADAAPASTAPEAPAEESEGRAAMARVFGAEA